MVPILEAFSNILICRTDNIGDVVQTLPLAGFLKSRFPRIRVEFLVRDYTAPLVQLSDFVDHVYSLETIGNAEQFFLNGKWSSVIFAWPERHLSMAAKQAQIRYRVGHSQRLHHWLTCNKLAHFSRSRPPRHEAQINFAFLRPLGISMQPDLSQIISWYGLHAKPDTRIDTRSPSGFFHLILHTKSGGNGREWPLSHYLELARLLLPQKDVVLWLTGSAEEGAYLQQHAPALLELENVVNLCGKFDLKQLASLIACADGLIASGTGPLHMAAALGRPTLGLFPTEKQVNPVRWGALGVCAQSMVISKPCKSCTSTAFCHCMEQIRPQQVMQVVTEWKSAWYGEKHLSKYYPCVGTRIIKLPPPNYPIDPE